MLQYVMQSQLHLAGLLQRLQAADLCQCGCGHQLCVSVAAGDWDPLQYVMQSQDLTSEEAGVRASQAVSAKPIYQHMVRTKSLGRPRGRPGHDMYMLPAEYTSIPDRPEVCLLLPCTFCRGAAVA